MRLLLKHCVNALSLTVVAPCALLCWVAKRLRPRSEAMFEFWAQWWALAPGLPGMYLRRAFYRCTLDQCAADCYIGFGAMFTHPTARVDNGVFIGTYALIGSVWLQEGCLVGSRASLLSGGRQHELGDDGKWSATDIGRLEQIEIGANSWLGEGVVVMADVGPSAMVAVGAVVSTRVPERVMVAGNPARFIRRLNLPEPEVRAGDNPSGAAPEGLGGDSATPKSET